LLNVSANAMKYDPFTRKLYAVIPSTSTGLTGNSIVAIDPATVCGDCLLKLPESRIRQLQCHQCQRPVISRTSGAGGSADPIAFNLHADLKDQRGGACALRRLGYKIDADVYLLPIRRPCHFREKVGIAMGSPDTGS
jgi:hypothetical protein